MKLKGIPAYVALVGGAIALYAFWKSGGVRAAQYDLANATGYDALKPTPTPTMTNPATGQPTFGVRNPWTNDPIFAPYEPTLMYAGGSRTFRESGPAVITTDAFGVSLN